MKDEATSILDERIQPAITNLINSIRKQDISSTNIYQEEAASSLANLRSLFLPKQVLPYSIPEEYANLPKLLGRATVDMEVENPKGFLTPENKKIPSVVFTMVVDGYHAPLTSGNFIDLVDSKFYNGLKFHKIEELTAQTGLPKTSTASSLRTVPLELFYKQDGAPTYGYTSDEDMRATETMALPFQAYGAVGTIHILF